VEGLRTLLEFDLDYSASVPVWDFGSAARDEVWCSNHYEQPGRVRGNFRFEGKDVAIDGVAFRDHSRGPRSLGAWAGHCWIHGQFAEGSAFAIFDTRKTEDGKIVTGIAKAVVWHEGRILPAHCADPPYLTSANNVTTAYRLTIESDAGKMAMEATTLRTLPISTTAKVESFIGRVPAELALFTAYQQPTEFRWDGRRGLGHSERSVLL
jgi:hypothetical protein